MYLKKCAEYEKTINKKNLEFHLKQGKFLEQLHSLWVKKRAKGLVLFNWNDWLKKKHIASSGRDVRKKKEISRIFEPFPRLRYVCISFNELQRRKNKIFAMFNTHLEIEEYWKKKEFLKDKVSEDEPMNQPEELRSDDVIKTLFCNRGPRGLPIHEF